VFSNQELEKCHRTDDQKHRYVVHGVLFVARRETTPVLELVEAPLDHISASVALNVDCYFAFTVTTGGNYRRYTPRTQGFAYLTAVVAFVAGKIDGVLPRTPAPDSLYFGHVHESQQVWCIMFFAASYLESERVSAPISSQMYFRTEASSTASERPSSPFFPPAACWWARITVLSTQCMSQSMRPFASISSRSFEKTDFHVPSACHR
jgi:hypothetical protein